MFPLVFFLSLFLPSLLSRQPAPFHLVESYEVKGPLAASVLPSHESRNRDSAVFTVLLAVFIRSSCSICWWTRLFRVGHKGTMMSYFVNDRRVCLIESNLGRRASFFVRPGASFSIPFPPSCSNVCSGSRGWVRFVCPLEYGLLRTRHG